MGEVWWDEVWVLKKLRFMILLGNGALFVSPLCLMEFSTRGCGPDAIPTLAVGLWEVLLILFVVMGEPLYGGTKYCVILL